MKFVINVLLNLKTNSCIKSIFISLVAFALLALILTTENTNYRTNNRKTGYSAQMRHKQGFLNGMKNSYNKLKKKAKDIFKKKAPEENAKFIQTPRSELLFEHEFYDSPVPSKWNPKIGVAYRDMAALGYMSKAEIESQLNELRKGASGDKSKISAIIRVLFEEQNWEYIGNHTGGAEDFSINVIRNKNKGKVVLAFSGTKAGGELLKQIINSGGKYYFRTSHKLSKIIVLMDYFQSLYQKVYKPLKELIEKAKDESIKQYIFTGHSRGGAMASIAVFDFLQEKLIEKTENSPVLITFGQPRVGNYAFANELMKAVPIVYRIVNRFDMVAGVPACIVDKKTKNCINEFGKEELEANFTDYKTAKKSLWNRLLKSVDFYPWHFGGLIYNRGEGESLTCNSSEPKFKTECRLETSMDINYHVYYFGYRFFYLVNPEVFRYNFISGHKKNSDTNEKNGMILVGSKRKVSASSNSVLAPAPFVLKDKPDNENGFGGALKSKLMEKLRSLNLINKKK